MLLMFSSTLAAVVQKSVRKESTAETLDKLENWPSYFRKTANIWNRHSSFLTSSILRNEFSDEVAHAVCKKAICQWTAWRDAMHFRGWWLLRNSLTMQLKGTTCHITHVSCMYSCMYSFWSFLPSDWKLWLQWGNTFKKRRNCFLLYLPRPPNDFCARS